MSYPRRHTLLNVEILEGRLVPSAGSLDPSFGIGGKVTIDGLAGNGRDIAVQPDGKILLGGWTSNDFALTRLEIDGELDSTFGVGGRVTTNIGTSFGSNTVDFGYALEVQSDGKIVTVGQSTINGGSMALTRHLPNGSLDGSFGVNGRVWVRIGGSNQTNGFGLAIQQDGKIVAVGGYNTGLMNYGAIVVRMLPNGQPDTSFDADGVVTTELISPFTNQRFHSVAVQPDGKIIAAGTSAGEFVLARFHNNGTLDSTFGIGGRARTAFPGASASAHQVMLLSDGRIIVAGSASAMGTPGVAFLALARFTAEGTLDSTFGSGGKATSPVNGLPEQVGAALQPDGRIVLSGVSKDGPSITPDFAIVRLNSDGTHDSTFGTAGQVRTDFGLQSFDQASSVAVQNDGRIIAAGTANSKLAVARYVALSHVNRPPIARDDSAATDDQSSVLLDLLANDHDPDGDTLAIESYTQGELGTVTQMGRMLLYTPRTNAAGVDSFSYVVQDGRGETASAIATITITDKTVPTVNDFRLFFGQDETKYVTASQLVGRVLPWTHIERISVEFSEDMVVTPDALAIRRIDGSTIGIAAFQYDQVSYRATWWLAQPLGRGKFEFVLNGDFSSLASDRNGNAADRVRVEAAVAPGDANGDGRTNWHDLRYIRRMKAEPYDQFADIDGNGVIDRRDAWEVIFQVRKTYKRRC